MPTQASGGDCSRYAAREFGASSVSSSRGERANQREFYGRLGGVCGRAATAFIATASAMLADQLLTHAHIVAEVSTGFLSTSFALNPDEATVPRSLSQGNWAAEHRTARFGVSHGCISPERARFWR